MTFFSLGSIRCNDGRHNFLPLAHRHARVIGTDALRILVISQLVDSFGQIKPLGSAAHLAIENQKGLTSEPLPLGISIADSSGGETVTVAGLAEGTELSLGTALGSGSSVDDRGLSVKDNWRQGSPLPRQRTRTSRTCITMH